ncbi:glycosyltransferase family 4 protein [Pseudalkalibacillus hwajinpoensis]|uniref:glycosyltransferase family 4 protein n=1 Tax=Guptibacillus hwajinpoensis TaxID=208199 RepID=UPI001CFDD50A|nr:glycosyltransferase family 1 protein [Pseudalkalibacillus hwajinpoensis]
MDVFINGRFLTQSVTGVQRYAREVVKALDKLIDIGYIDRSKYSFYILTPNLSINELHLNNITVRKIGKFKGHLWEQIELPIYVKGEMLLNLCNAGPGLKKEQITVIHDAAVFANSSNFSFIFRNWYKAMLSAQAKFSKKIVTVSEFSRDEITKYLKHEKEKIKVIYEGNEHITFGEEATDYIENKGLDKKPYILAVSSLNPNKNFSAIVKAMTYLESNEFNIVIAGGTDPKVFSQDGIDLPDNVIHLGYVSDSELKALYRNAFCFVYPSFYEGFGLPPLEAMSLGCPIILSNRASLPEVGGKAVLYCNPDKPKDIADEIQTLLSNRDLRNELIEKGLEQSSKFSWENCAKELFNSIND